MSYTISGGTALLDPMKLAKVLGVTAGMSVADFGCGGNGHFIYPLAQLVGREGMVYAVDIRKEVLSAVEMRAKQYRFYQVEPRWANLEKAGSTKIANDSLDAVLIINVLFQNSSPEKILQEAKRVLKVGGKLLVVDWKYESSSFGPPLTRRLDQERVTEKAEKLGLSLERSFLAGPKHYGIIFKKV